LARSARGRQQRQSGHASPPALSREPAPWLRQLEPGQQQGAAAGAPPTRFDDGDRRPFDTLSPTFTFSAFTTPACDDGISIDALSLSTVIRLCSTFTVSPTFTSSSMTATSSKSPMSGTTISTLPVCPEAGASTGSARAGAGAAAAAAAGTGAAAGVGAVTGAAAPAASSTSTSVPSDTLSPSLTFSSFTTPACDDGISIDALSLSTVNSDCSAFTVSPGFTRTSMTSTSLKSPMSGTLTSTNAMLFVSVGSSGSQA
jgi:hypothetical protein